MMKLVQQASFSLPKGMKIRGPGPKSKIRSHKCATTSLYQKFALQSWIPEVMYENAEKKHWKNEMKNRGFYFH